MILNEDFDANLCCSHKYYIYWWHKIKQEELCMIAIEHTILNIPLEYFELWRVQDTMDYIRQKVEKVLEEYKIDLEVMVTQGRYWFGVAFTKRNKLGLAVTFAHLFLNERE